MSMKRQKSPLVASMEYNNRTWPDGGIESFSEGDEPPMMMGTEALGNGNDHFGIHEQNQFCKQRGCILFDVSGMGDERLREALDRLKNAFCGCDVMRGYTCGIHAHIVAIEQAAAPEPQPAPSPAVGAQHDIQRGQYVWVKGVVVGGDQPRDFPKRARIHVYGIGTGIPKEFKPVTEAAQPSPAPAGESVLQEVLPTIKQCGTPGALEPKP